MTVALNKSWLTILMASTILTGLTVQVRAQPQAEETTETTESDTKAAPPDSLPTKDRSVRRKLVDRIKSVQRKTFLKKKRVEIFPFFAMDLNDPFYQHFLAGASLSFHLVDSFALELKGGAVVGTINQDAVKLVRVNEGAICENCPQLKYHADANLGWSPIYGKLSLLGESIVHFDTYFSVGGGVFATDSGSNPSVNVGVGQRDFFNDWLVGRIEVRDYIFMDSRNEISDIQNVMLLSFSLSGFFPTSFEYEFR